MASLVGAGTRGGAKAAEYPARVVPDEHCQSKTGMQEHLFRFSFPIYRPGRQKLSACFASYAEIDTYSKGEVCRTWQATLVWTGHQH